MGRNVITIRTYPGGAPATGMDYRICLETDPTCSSPLQSGSTNPQGQVIYTPNGSPGPWRIESTDDSGDIDITRVISSKSVGSGGTYSLAEIPVALRVLGNGVIDNYLEEMLVQDPDSGPNLTINTGAVIVNGIVATWPADVTHAVAAAQDATNPKRCYVGIEVTGSGQSEEGKAVIKDYCGAAEASPVLPSITAQQTEASYFEPLFAFTLGNSAASNANDVTSLADVRRYAMQRHPTIISVAYRTSLTPKVITSPSGEDVTWSSGSTSTTLLDGVVYDLYADTSLQVQAPASQTISIAVRINGNDGTYVPSSVSSGYSLVAASHFVGTVTGTGASLAHTVMGKVSGGSGNVLTGFLRIVGIPRS